MSQYYDKASGLLLGDTGASLAGLRQSPQAESFSAYCSDLILSASGWRKVFAASANEEDPNPNLNPEAYYLAAAMALAYLDFLKEETGRKEPGIALGMDSRPSGPEIANAMLRVFLAGGARIHYLFIAAAPEIMAYTRSHQELDGFAYISASHNPIGHNGTKFGLNTGGVLGGRQAGTLISRLRTLIEDPNTPERLKNILDSVRPADLESCFVSAAGFKAASLEAYARFSDQVCADSQDPILRNERMTQLRAALRKTQIGLVAELNGSARSVSIDRSYFEGLGLRLHMVNDKPGQIVHRIVPEGASLDLCRRELEEAHARDPAFVLGYVPDNDGDRGNLVWYDRKQGVAKEIEAQQLFCLSVAAELSWLAHTGALDFDSPREQKVAVVVNCPSSLRVEALAERFGVSVFRAEVGEANVVGLAGELRAQGWTVRVLGEGSNGGNITHPSAVRDPLNTICSILKLMSMRELSEIFEARMGLKLPAEPELGDYLAALPQFSTSSAYEARAIMQVKSRDHGALKNAYEAIFPRYWQSFRSLLAPSLGIESWEVINYEGTKSRVGMGPEFRSGAQRGGFKIQFLDADAKPQAFVWMRGSGTEPVFRVLADLKGIQPDLEVELLELHKALIQEADQIASAE